MVFVKIKDFSNFRVFRCFRNKKLKGFLRFLLKLEQSEVE